MVLKYAEHIECLQNCPPGNCQKCTRDAFRFVFADINHPQNFLPVALKNPSRLLGDDTKRCSDHALSFFNSRENAIGAFQRMSRRFKNIRKTIGDHLATGTLQPQDGVATPVSRSGHFDLFEEDDCQLAGRFRVVGALA